MKFHEYFTTLQMVCRVSRKMGTPAPTAEELQHTLEIAKSAMTPDQWTMSALHWDFDRAWTAEDRPYYRVYPSLIQMLCRLNLSTVSGTHIQMPHGLSSLLIQFPSGHELDGEVRTIWVLRTQVMERGQVKPGLAIGIDQGEVRKDMPVYLIRCFPLDERTVSECLDALLRSPSSDIGKQLPHETKLRCLSLVCTLLLLGDDSELLEPDVLARDRQHVSQDNLEALVERARQKGKRGWDVGRGIEVVPHYRRPHPALVWTGAGRKVPKIVMRSGAVVHRSVVGAVPAGFLGEIGDS